MLKQACREFCAGVEPDFKPFLQEILLIESKRWIYFDTAWSSFFQFGNSYDCPKYIYNKNYGDLLPIRVNILKHPGEWTEKLIMSFYEVYKAIPRSGTGIFLRELSGEEAVEYVGKVLKAISQRNLHIAELAMRASTNILYDKRGNYLSPSPELGLRNLEFIKNTPFYALAQVKIAYDLPPNSRKTHQWIIGASGAGKTQLLQRMICDDIEHGRSVVVIDSQRDMINELLRLKHAMEVVIIDPEDIEYPPGISLFDMQFADEGQKTRIIEFYEYMFSVFGAELSSRQGSLFSFALRLMFTIPGANIQMLIDLFRNGDKYRPFMEKLKNRAEYNYFKQDFFDKQYFANKKQILDRLRKIEERPVLERVFAGTENKIDFFQLLQKPVVMLINTSKYHCGKVGCKLFGRFLISRIYDAILQRATIPREMRRQVYIYVDEGKDYGDEQAFEDIVYECRKYAGALIFCSQNIGQLHPDTVAALMTSSIKLVRRLEDDTETRKMARTIRVDEHDLYDLAYKDKEYAEWMCYVANEGTTKIRCDFGYLENQPKMSEAEYQHLREENRRKYCVRAAHDIEREHPGQSSTKPPSQGDDVPKNDKPTGTEPPDDDDDYY